MRSLFSACWMLVRRRARRDAGLLAGWMLLVAFATLLAAAIPAVVIGTVDQGAREAVASAGSNADVLVHAHIGAVKKEGQATPKEVMGLARDIPARLPSALRRVYASTTLSVLSPQVTLSPVGVPGPPLPVYVGMLTAAQSATMTLEAGRMPHAEAGTGGDDIEVVVSSEAARQASVTVGTVLGVPQLTQRDAVNDPAANPEPGAEAAIPPSPRLRVVGITKSAKGETDPGAAPADQQGTDQQPAAITVLTTPEGTERAESLFIDPLDATIRLHLNPAAFTGELEARVADEISGLPVDTEQLAGSTPVALQVSSGFIEELADFPRQTRAAVAQMSLMVAGVLGVAATAMLLLSRLLVLRRAGDLALERARGASLASIATRATVESLVTTVIGGALGVVAVLLCASFAEPARAPLSTVPVLTTPVFIVLAIAVLATPAQSLLHARTLWRGRREPANRQARAEIARRRRVRRLVAELGVLVLAAAALVSVQNRGLLQTRTDAIDPLLVAAPLLTALAITLIVLRIYPWAVRAAAALGRRSRGAWGVLGAAQASGALAALPLIALTLAVGLAVSGGMLIDSVRSGQVDASWQRVGADVRVEAPVTAQDVAAVAASPGVVASGSVSVVKGVTILDGPALAITTLLAIDHGYANVLTSASRKSGEELGGDAAVLRSLAKASASASASEPLPVVVDRELAGELVSKNPVASIGDDNVRLRLIGIVDATPDGYRNGPNLYVDLHALSERLSKPVTANSLLAAGPGASAAAAKLDVPHTAVVDRAEWLDARRHLALVTGVSQVMLLSAAAVALLAVMALIATVVAGARRRSRSLSLLRTLGVSGRLAWWLGFVELAPVVVAAVIGGVGAGIGIVLALGPSLGLAELAGGVGDPVLRVSATVVFSVVGGAVLLLGLAMLTEIVTHRRDRLSQVLRVGETV